jgi:hypothetical protein
MGTDVQPPLHEPLAGGRRVQPESPMVVAALGLAFLLSGSAGLVHEVVWTRLVGRVFGVSELATSTVLAAPG